MNRKIISLIFCLFLFGSSAFAEEIVDGVVVGGEQYNDARYLRQSQNLSDVDSAATAFGNIKQNASESATGVVELSTDAETQTGTDTARAITPANLSARTATEARTGVIELSTDAETQTGTDTARAITPANLSARTATEARTGVIELATNAEGLTGTDTARAITPSVLTYRRGFNDISVKTDTYVITTSDFGKTIIMNAGTEKTLSAPSVDENHDGALITIMKAGAGKVIFDCADSDTVADSGAGDTIYDDVAAETYATLTLQYVHSLTKWVIRMGYGTWTTTD